MANLKRAMTAEWLKQRTNNLFLPKNHGIFTTPVGFDLIAAMSQSGVDTKRSETKNEIQTCLETLTSGKQALLFMLTFASLLAS